MSMHIICVCDLIYLFIKLFHHVGFTMINSAIIELWSFSLAIPTGATQLKKKKQPPPQKNKTKKNKNKTKQIVVSLVYGNNYII